MPDSFDALVTDALAQPHEGWDFSYIRDRWHSENPPWVYGDEVLTKLNGVEALLDMGTGGGEFLISLHERAPTWPRRVVATEGYAPNVAVAARNLAPIGVQVVGYTSDEELPLDENVFDLVINRHESFAPQELKRILKPGRLFITQQVGGEMNIGLNHLLQGPTPIHVDHTLGKALQALTDAALASLEQRESRRPVRFDDVGAIVWYLTVVSWQIPDFSVERYADRLRALHRQIEEEGSVEVSNHHFYIEAGSPGS